MLRLKRNMEKTKAGLKGLSVREITLGYTA